MDPHTLSTNVEHLIDVRYILPRFRHSIIFEKWNALPLGDAIHLMNDHDPTPLYYQFAAEYKDQYEWQYLEKGPDRWLIKILKKESPPSSSSNANHPPYIITHKSVFLDVRPLFQKGESPCGIIDEAIDRVQPHQIFQLIAPFEPLPLIAKLNRLGFSHTSKQQDDGSWKLEFRKKETCECSCEKKTSTITSQGSDIIIDARDLGPPEPLIQTLEALAKLKKGYRLTLYSNRKPVHLLEELSRRGFAYDCSQQTDRTFLTHLWHSD